jgi:hypothetical protein
VAGAGGHPGTGGALAFLGLRNVWTVAMRSSEVLLGSREKSEVKASFYC